MHRNTIDQGKHLYDRLNIFKDVQQKEPLQLMKKYSFFIYNRIEKSREVLPQLVAAVQGLSKKKRKLNNKYFFDLLFTRMNLKLVHIACHDKREHTDAQCDPKKFYI